MREPPASSAPAVYQLRVVLRHISPLIWRRLLVRGDGTVADLHPVLQIAFGWSDEHLHRFVIQGHHYGDGGRADPRCVRLSDLLLRVGERWLYEYDFTDGWQHDIRLEQIVPLCLARAIHAA
jgi:Plasmid pRiA4b ORF-3-like protein